MRMPIIPSGRLFNEAGHQLDEITRLESVVELVNQNIVPGILAGAG